MRGRKNSKSQWAGSVSQHDVPDEEEVDDEGSTRKVLDAESAASGGGASGERGCSAAAAVCLDFLKMDLSIAVSGDERTDAAV